MGLHYPSGYSSLRRARGASAEPLINEQAFGRQRFNAHGATLASHETSLLWSEHVYLGAASLALLLTVSMPEWGLQSNAVLKHLPLLLAGITVWLSIMGRQLRAPMYHRVAAPSTLAMTWGMTWPWWLLALFILTGSVHARLAEGIRSTFSNVGLYILMVPLAAAMLVNSRAPLRLLRSYCRLLLLAGACMLLGLLYYYRSKQVYHEQIFLLIPLAVLCVLSPARRIWAWCGALLCLGASVLSAKNTSYLIALLVVAYLVLLLWLPRIQRTSSLLRWLANYVSLLMFLLAALVMAYVLYYREHYLPSGNVAYRSHTYALAWQQFLDSPLWGTAFHAESVRKFSLYQIGIANNRLPTHSDVMDLLANGGLLAMTLWLIGYWRIARLAYRQLLAPRLLQDPQLAPFLRYAHTLAVISLAACITYAFNPILLQAPFAFMVWTTLGLLLGVALRQRAGSLTGIPS